MNLTTTSPVIINTAMPLLLIVKYSNTYLIPFIVMMGVVGNISSFVVFVFSKLNRISTSIYLAALSISDTGFLLCVWVGWFDIIGINFFHREGICHIVVFMTYVFGFTSVWYVNAFTTDMYVAVFYSSLGTKVCRPGFAKKAVVGLTSFAVIFYLFSFWTSKIVDTGNGRKKCVSAPHNYDQMMIFTLLDTLLTLIIPFSMIIFMITRLLIDISKFYRSESQQNDEVTHSESSNSLTTGENATNSSAQQGMKAQAKLKRMIVVVILVFLVLNLPCHVIRLQSILRSAFDKSYVTTTNEILWQMFFQIIYYVNFSVNFVLYSVCGRSFRSALMQFPLRSCIINCRNCCGRFNRMATYKVNSNKIRQSDENENIGGNVHSRLVDIHLSELHVSQMPSFESDFVLQSPPCRLMGVSSNTEQTRI